MHALGRVEAPVLREDGLDIIGDKSVLGQPLSRRLLPLPPVVEAAACHPQKLVQTGDGVTVYELTDQTKPLGGSCSFAKCTAASLKKNVLPLEFSAFLSLAVELSAFLAGEQVMITGPRLVLVDASLANQGGLAAGVKTQPLGYSAE